MKVLIVGSGGREHAIAIVLLKVQKLIRSTVHRATPVLDRLLSVWI